MQNIRGEERFDSFQLDFVYFYQLFDICHIEVKRVSSKRSLLKETKKAASQVAAFLTILLSSENLMRTGRNMGFYDKRFFAKSFSVRSEVPGFMLLSSSTAFNDADFVSTSSTIFKRSSFHSFLCIHVGTFAVRHLSFKRHYLRESSFLHRYWGKVPPTFFKNSEILCVDRP